MIQGQDIAAPKRHVVQKLLIYKAYLYAYSMQGSGEKSEHPSITLNNGIKSLFCTSRHPCTHSLVPKPRLKKRAFCFGPLKSEDCSLMDQSVCVCFRGFCI